MRTKSKIISAPRNKIPVDKQHDSDRIAATDENPTHLPGLRDVKTNPISEFDAMTHLNPSVTMQNQASMDPTQQIPPAASEYNDVPLSRISFVSVNKLELIPNPDPSRQYGWFVLSPGYETNSLMEAESLGYVLDRKQTPDGTPFRLKELTLFSRPKSYLDEHKKEIEKTAMSNDPSKVIQNEKQRFENINPDLSELKSSKIQTEVTSERSVFN